MTTNLPESDPRDSIAPSVRLVPMPSTGADSPPEAGIADRLKYARSELSLSIEALSRLTKRYDPHEGKGVSPSSLLRYESGESLPGGREIRLLCEAFAVPTQWLILGQIPNSGRTASQQELIAAIARFIRETMSDIPVGGELVSEMQQRSEERARAEWITEARKPGVT